MRRAILTMILAVSLCEISAARVYEPLEGAYEVALGDVVMPNGSAGTAVLRPCTDCDTVALRVSAGTRYLLNGRALALPDFLAAVDGVRRVEGGNGSMVGVYYDLKTNQITRIAVYPPRA